MIPFSKAIDLSLPASHLLAGLLLRVRAH